MMDKFKKAMEAYNLQQFFGGQIKKQREIDEAVTEGFKEGMKGDSRYNQPKEEPKVSQEKVEQTIEETEIYRRAKELILKAQQKQVAYGLDKYPTPLSADVWDILETIDHITDESIDQLHYLTMLRIHLERMMATPRMILDFKSPEEAEKFRKEWDAKSNKIYADGMDISAMYPSMLEDEESPKSINDYREKLGYEPIPVEWSKMPGYAMADVDATRKMWEAMSKGVDVDGDFVHEYTNYVNERPNFSICQQPDYENDAQEISITMTVKNDELLKHDDSVDALMYSIKHHLDKMKSRGLI